MKRMRIVGLCLFAIGAMFALSVSSASAESLPEFGKCTKTEVGKGAFKNSGCTKKAGANVEEHKFEWAPLSSAVKFTSLKKAETGEAVLEAANENKIHCKNQKQTEGEYGPGKYEEKNVIGEFSGCEALGAECSSAGQSAGNIHTLKLHGEPGVVTKNGTNEEKNVDGADLRGQTSEFLAEFSCGPAPVLVRGGVVVKAGAVVSGTFKSATNKMLNKQTIEFVAEPKGIQVPSEWTPNGTGVSNSKHEQIKEVLEGSTAGQPFERSGQSLITVQTTSPKTVKVELRQCKSAGC
jgi:hypothetical protein